MCSAENLKDEAAFALAVEALQGQSETLRLPDDFLAAKRQKFLEERGTKINFEEAEEQAHMIFDQLTKTQRLIIITGPPGAAKTTVAAHWVRLARAHNSYLPIVLVSSEKTALTRLQDRLVEAVPDRVLTLQQALQDPKPWPKYASVLIDEAGLIDTKTMAMLLTQAVETQAARVILIGDDKQLLPNGAGQPFRWLRENKKAAIFELLCSYRQKTPHLRQVITDLYHGDARAAFDKIIPAFLLPERLPATIGEKLQQLGVDKTVVVVHGPESLRAQMRQTYPKAHIYSLNEAQGLAFDQALFVIAQRIDLSEMLVGSSRQRHSLDIFVDESIYPNREALLEDLTDWSTKEMALDQFSLSEILQKVDQG